MEWEAGNFRRVGAGNFSNAYNFEKYRVWLPVVASLAYDQWEQTEELRQRQWRITHLSQTQLNMVLLLPGKFSMRNPAP